MGASFSVLMGQFSNPVATHPRTIEVEVPPPPRKHIPYKIATCPERVLRQISLPRPSLCAKFL